MIKYINFRAFIKPFLFLSLLVFVGCSTIANKSVSKPQEKNDPKISNSISVYYYTMAETALQNGDYELALNLYMKADESAPNNVYIKEIILEILALAAQFNPEDNAKLIELGESYLERNIVSQRILDALANAYISTADNENAKRIFKMLVDDFPTMENCLFYFLSVSNTEGKKDYKILDKALGLEWKDINQVISVLLQYDDDKKIIDIIHKAYLTWTDKKPKKSKLKSDYKKFGLDRIISDFIYEAVQNGQQINDQISEVFFEYLINQDEFDKLLSIYPKFINSGSKYVQASILVFLVEKKDWENVAKIGSLLLQEDNIKAPDFVQYNTALAFAELNDYQQVLYVLSLSKELPKTIVLFASIYQKADAEGRKILLNNIGNYWSDESTLFALKMISDIIEENNSQLLASIENMPSGILGNNEVLSYLSNFLLDNGKINEAEIILDKINDEKLEVTSYVAEYLSYIGKYDLVLEYLQEKISKQEDLNERDYYMAAIAASKQGKIDLFLQLMDLALEMSPEDPMLLNAFGYTIADENLVEHFPQAEKFIKKALEEKPQEAMYWDSLAWLYYRQGKYLEAEKIMLEHCESILDDSAISYHLAEIYLKLDKMDQALDMINRSIKSDSDQESVEKSLELRGKYFDENEFKEKE